MVGGRTRFGEEWQEIGSTYTTARPQIVCIGPVGETKSQTRRLDFRQRDQCADWRLRCGLRGQEFESDQRSRNRRRADVGSRGGPGSQTPPDASQGSGLCAPDRGGVLHALLARRSAQKQLLWRRNHVRLSEAGSAAVRARRIRTGLPKR